MVTSQVKYAIEKMLQAGFKRSEFKCHVERRKVRGGYEYGNARIRMYNQKKIDSLKIEILKAGLTIREVIFDSGQSHKWIEDMYHEDELGRYYLSSDSQKKLMILKPVSYHYA